MAFVSLDPADIAGGQPIDEDLMAQIKENQDSLNSAIGTLATTDIPNGNMEIDSDSDDTPDSWAVTTYPSGTQTLETSSPLNGTQSMKFTHPGGGGNGGGYADSDYLPCGNQNPFKISWLLKSSNTTMRNQVDVRWFDKDKVYISTTNLYAPTASPTTTQAFHGIAAPPSTARFYRVRITGGLTSVSTAGTTVFDSVHSMGVNERKQVVSGAVSSVIFTDIKADSELTQLQIIGAGASVATLRFSTDNGATWISSASYSYWTGTTYTFNATSIGITGPSFGISIDGTYELAGLVDSARYGGVMGQAMHSTSGVVNNSIEVYGKVNVTTAINAIQIIISTSSGTFVLRQK